MNRLKPDQSHTIHSLVSWSWRDSDKVSGENSILNRAPSLVSDLPMTCPRDPLRRWVGLAFLTVAVGMLVAGLTVLEARLKRIDFLLYWLVCFVFTGLSAMTALWDGAVVRRQSRLEQQRLIQETLARTAGESRQYKDPENHG